MHTLAATPTSATPTVLNTVTIPQLEHVALEETRFEDLYRREYPGLVAVATALSGHDGEDLVHDAMVKALMNWKPRLAITLYYAGDRTTAEVASILDVPEGTVRSDLSRARAALARELEV